MNSKDQASLKAIDERSSLNTLIQEERTQRDALNAAQDSLDVQLRKLEKAQTEEASLLERKATVRPLLYFGVGKCRTDFVGIIDRR